MYCIGCGKKIQDGAKFCINCGREIGKSENSIKTEKNLSDVQTEENGNSTKNGCKFLLIPAIVYIVLGSIGSIYGNTRSVWGPLRHLYKEYGLLVDRVFQSADIFIALIVAGVIMLALTVFYKLRKIEINITTKKYIFIGLLAFGIVISVILAVPYVLFAVYEMRM